MPALLKIWSSHIRINVLFCRFFLEGRCFFISSMRAFYGVVFDIFWSPRTQRFHRFCRMTLCDSHSRSESGTLLAPQCTKWCNIWNPRCRPWGIVPNVFNFFPQTVLTLSHIFVIDNLYLDMPNLCVSFFEFLGRFSPQIFSQVSRPVQVNIRQRFFGDILFWR